MVNEKAFNRHLEILDRVVERLVRNGVPSDRIVREKQILRRDAGRYDADIAVLNDHNGVEAVYEIKIGNGKDPRIVSRVRQNMRSVIGLCRCYLVTDAGEDLIIAQVLPEGTLSEWKKLDEFSPCIGVPQSDNVKTVAKDCDPLRLWIVAVGLFLVAVFMWGEVSGVEFSWKVFSLIFLMVALFAAASGYKFTIKAATDGCELTVGGDVKKEGTYE